MFGLLALRAYTCAFNMFEKHITPHSLLLSSVHKCAIVFTSSNPTVLHSAKAQAVSDVRNPKAVDGELAQVVGIGLEHLPRDKPKRDYTCASSTS